MGTVSTQIYDFRIKFSQFSMISIANNILEIKGKKETKIDRTIIFYETSPQITGSDEILYTILKSPKYGTITTGNILQVWTFGEGR